MSEPAARPANRHGGWPDAWQTEDEARAEITRARIAEAEAADHLHAARQHADGGGVPGLLAAVLAIALLVGVAIAACALLGGGTAALINLLSVIGGNP